MSKVRDFSPESFQKDATSLIYYVRESCYYGIMSNEAEDMMEHPLVREIRVFLREVESFQTVVDEGIESGVVSYETLESVSILSDVVNACRCGRKDAFDTIVQRISGVLERVNPSRKEENDRFSKTISDISGLLEAIEDDLISKESAETLSGSPNDEIAFIGRSLSHAIEAARHGRMFDLVEINASDIFKEILDDDSQYPEELFERFRGIAGEHLKEFRRNIFEFLMNDVNYNDDISYAVSRAINKALSRLPEGTSARIADAEEDIYNEKGAREP